VAPDQNVHNQTAAVSASGEHGVHASSVCSMHPCQASRDRMQSMFPLICAPGGVICLPAMVLQPGYPLVPHHSRLEGDACAPHSPIGGSVNKDPL